MKLRPQAGGFLQPLVERCSHFDAGSRPSFEQVVEELSLPSVAAEAITTPPGPAADFGSRETEPRAKTLPKPTQKSGVGGSLSRQDSHLWGWNDDGAAVPEKSVAGKSILHEHSRDKMARMEAERMASGAARKLKRVTSALNALSRVRKAAQADEGSVTV